MLLFRVGVTGAGSAARAAVAGANAATPYNNTVWRRAMSTKATGDVRKDERPSIPDNGAGPAVVEEGGKASGGRCSDDETGQWYRWLVFLY